MGPSRWLAVALAAARSGAMVHDLKIHGDERSLYRIESFCFLEGGVLDLRVTNFKIDAKGPFRAGFVMRRASSESAAQQELEESLEANACLLDWGTGNEGDLAGGDTVFELDMSDPTQWRGELVRQHRIEKAEEGLYSLIFVRCEPSEGRASTSFDLEAKFYNKGPSYLSACEAPLPMLFAVFFGLFLATSVLWGAVLCSGAKQGEENSAASQDHRHADRRSLEIVEAQARLVPRVDICTCLEQRGDCSRVSPIRRVGQKRSIVAVPNVHVSSGGY